jgi:putative ABC transport system permease protein
LLVLTVSLAAFSASLATTLDLQLNDALLYRTGADVALTGAGVDFTPPGPFEQPTADTAAGGLFLPLDEYLELPGVVAATRLGRYPAEAQVGETEITGTYLGLDRANFATAAFWRYDFAGQRLGALMNALAAVPEGLLVSRDFLDERGLSPGDLMRLTVTAPDGVVELDAQILAALDYFPTWYAAEAGPLFVGNLDTLFAAAGSDMAYEVWLRTAAAPDTAAFDAALRQRGLFGWRYDEPHTAIAAELGRPERQGLFGQLSVGFIAAALLTVLGFFMYALFSFRQRLISLGILRAMGLSAGQLATLVAFELGVLILSGLGLGTVLGVWISRLFIPYLQIGATTASLIPPYLVEIAWPAVYRITALFGLLFLAAVALLTWLLRRMRLFQAIKLGETA